MKLQKIISQIRRDFVGIFVCEHCGHEIKRHGYDDTNFHRNVIPKMKCSECGKTADEDYRPISPKYPDSMVI